MAGQKSTGEEILSRTLGIVIAAGALAVGVAAALMNNERTRQVQEELRARVDELGKQVSDLTTQAQSAILERRPEIEQTIQRSRRAALDGLEKAKSVVEQGADKAQEYVQRAGQPAQDAQGGTPDAEQPAHVMGSNGHAPEGHEPLSYDESDEPASY